MVPKKYVWVHKINGTSLILKSWYEYCSRKTTDITFQVTCMFKQWTWQWSFKYFI